MSVISSDSAKIRGTRIDNIKTDKYAAIYKFDSAYTDSSLVCERWFLADTLVKETGKFYYRIPFESEFVDGWIIESAKGKTIYETFDSLICEVGGHSAWNKYVFNYDDKKRPQSVRHYKAWWNEGLGESPRPPKPGYFLGETIYFYYNNGELIQVANKKSGRRIEKITKRFDNKSRLEFEEWDAWDSYRFRIYYKYKE